MLKRNLATAFAAGFLAVFAGSAAALADVKLGWIEIDKAPLESQPPLGVLMPPDERQPTMRDLVEAFDAAASRDDIKGVVIRLRQPALNMAQVEELGAAMKRLRDSGRKIHLFTEIYGVPELILGAYADEVIVQKGGAVNFHGMYMEEMFLADTLSLLGVKMDYVQVGKFKGASEQLGRSEPSPEWDQNITQLLDGMYTTLRGHMKAGRGMSDAQVDRAMEKGWLASPEQGVALGLVDTVVDRLDLEDHLDSQYGGVEYTTDLIRFEDNSQAMMNPFTALRVLFEPPDRTVTRETIALVHIDGAIIDGESSRGAMGGDQVGSLTIRQALAEVEAEDNIKGVVVRIDSPGGSAIASESIWLGLDRLAESKPVWVSVGSMAASGGYYCAVAGEKIYVNPMSIVGSIGVVGGKPVLGGLYEWGQVGVVARSRGPSSGMFSTLTPWTDEERAMVRQRMEETYEQFTGRVKQGRPQIDLSKTAEGRLFTGEKAIELGMADKIGGVDVAVSDMASELGLEPGEFDVMSWPEPPTLAQVLEEAFGRFVETPRTPGTSFLMTEAAAALRSVVGERAWPSLRDSIEAMSLLKREPVLLTLPRGLIFR